MGSLFTLILVLIIIPTVFMRRYSTGWWYSYFRSLWVLVKIVIAAAADKATNSSFICIFITIGRKNINEQSSVCRSCVVVVVAAIVVAAAAMPSKRQHFLLLIGQQFLFLIFHWYLAKEGGSRGCHSTSREM